MDTAQAIQTMNDIIRPANDHLMDLTLFYKHRIISRDTYIQHCTILFNEHIANYLLSAADTRIQNPKPLPKQYNINELLSVTEHLQSIKHSYMPYLFRNPNIYPQPNNNNNHQQQII
ncbi:hypothetical protein PPL_07430 [Heterostelium album PN500]|uniref:Uncharacterized protein n=1 Tax=Heterostelium pallidum (strain ATCC 26659 / Pp 5 / PN500) TaxID=670386 RepID=D3BFX9_HETP5|nr:hypothetical protein PPL_07430 [Heterostelium album PN500]EFA79739.1 hypothetical protein PPL_07430 [Heterostelium album PN500]|eukprot:XP_020431860.1 hypothetical protein PPL_07430 [Heterostelium album PN500]